MTLLIFLAVLSVLVLIHELGHFLAARMMGIKVEEFAFGLPFTKPLLSVKRGETSYSVYPLIFGGFVRLHGEESEVNVDKARSFWDRGRKQRMMVIVAGVVMNVVLAMVAFAVVYVAIGVPKQLKDKVTVVGVSESSPALAVGLKVKDRIVAVEGKPIATSDEFKTLMKSWAGLPVQITVQSGETVPLFEGIAERGRDERVVEVVPRLTPPANEGPLGVQVVSYPYLSGNRCQIVDAGCWVQIPGAAVGATVKWAGRVLDGLRNIGKSLLAAKAPEGVSGPIGIYQLTGVVASEGWLPLTELVAVLSINLAVFNILPIPALDGGRAAMVWLEWARKKRVDAELEAKINSWGMVFLLGILALVTFQDVLNLDWVKKLFGK